jgi:hypothetical protein
MGLHWVRGADSGLHSRPRNLSGKLEIGELYFDQIVTATIAFLPTIVNHITSYTIPL